MSSDESIVETNFKRKRKSTNVIDDSSSDSSISPANSKFRKINNKKVIPDSDSSEDEDIVSRFRRKKRIPKVPSDTSPSSGSDIIRTNRRPPRLVSESSSDESDGGFEGSSSSGWESDTNEAEHNAKSNVDKSLESDTSDAEAEKCPICLLAFKQQEVGTPESCDHTFCVECIQEWSKNVNTCPVDRQPFTLILVRATLNGKITREIHVETPAPQQDLEIIEDPTYCEICGSCDREDRMLLCDGCDLGYHLECLDPPLQDVPEGSWYCEHCYISDESDIGIYEIQMLFDDADAHGWPQAPRRRTENRIIPRTRHSERVRQRVTRRRNAQSPSEQVVTSSGIEDTSQAGTSTQSTPNSVTTTQASSSQKKRRSKKRKRTRYRTVYKIDEATGETVAVKKKTKRRRKGRRARERARRAGPAMSTRRRLAQQLGICRPQQVKQFVPEMKVQTHSDKIGVQRYSAGIPTLHLFGQQDQLDYFSNSDEEYEMSNVVVRRRPNMSDAAVLRRRAQRKSIALPTSTLPTATDLLGSIMDSQTRLYSRNTDMSLNEDGTLSVRLLNTEKRVNVNNNSEVRCKQMPMYPAATNNGGNVSGNVNHNSLQNSGVYSGYMPTSTVSTSNLPSRSNVGAADDFEGPHDYSQATMSAIYDLENKEKDKKEKEERNDEYDRGSGTNTPNTEHNSDADVDIYSDIETVSTSKADESEFKPVSPVPAVACSAASDEENNDSDTELVIDTEKAEPEKEPAKDEIVSSSVDSTFEPAKSLSVTAVAHSTSDMEPTAVQSTSQTQLFGPKENEEDEDDNVSEDGCPNFNIYSTESINLAKTTDLELLSENSITNDADKSEVACSEVSSTPTAQTAQTSDDICNDNEENDHTDPAEASDSKVSSTPLKENDEEHEDSTLKLNDDPASVWESLCKSYEDEDKDRQTPTQDEEEHEKCIKEEASEPKDAESITDVEEKNEKVDKEKKAKTSGGLYSDSEDEVKIDMPSTFGISDIRNMTEDISEEERSYTPCLDENQEPCQKGLDGLDTELISDEDRNDFDESHEQKATSDGEALEINAKESELEFTKPEDYEEGEIVDKNKTKKDDEEKEKESIKPEAEAEAPIKKSKKKERDRDSNEGNKENENQNKDSSFKKLSRSNKERNYRDKDRERSRSKEKKDKDGRKDRRKEKRKELERYDVRSIIAEKPRRLKDEFGRDLKRSPSRSSRSLTPRLSSPVRQRRSSSKSKSKKRRGRSKDRRSVSRSRSPDRRRSRSRNRKRRRSTSRRRKSRDRSKVRSKIRRKVRSRTRSPSLKRRRDWTPSISRSRTPDIQRYASPSWTPPRTVDQTMKPHNLTVILTNDKKKKDKKKRSERKGRDSTERQRKRKRGDRTPPPSKEVFASGDNILVSVSFNKDSDNRDVTTKRKRDMQDGKKSKKDKKNRTRRGKDLSGIKPVAIIDLDRSPFKELTPSPKDIIVLSDSDNAEGSDMMGLQKAMCDSSSQQVASPEPPMQQSYTTGPKTPPEPQIKFTLTAKQPQLRVISNPLHEPDEVEGEIDVQEELEQRLNDVMHKGPNTPPEPPNSPPSSPDAYDPFDPTKSRSPTPEPSQNAAQMNGSNMEPAHTDDLHASESTEKSNTPIRPATPELLKSHTPPAIDTQPDSQSSILESSTGDAVKSPEVQQITPMVNKNLPAAVPYSSQSITTSTPVTANLTIPRINILNSTILTPSNLVSALPRIILPTAAKSSPVKVAPSKTPIKSTPIKPMPTKSLMTKQSRKSGGRAQNSGDSEVINLDFDSPYSPGSSDYEDLFEPPPETGKAVGKTPAKQPTKSPAKAQNAFDALFGSSPVYNSRNKTRNEKMNKIVKKVPLTPQKGTKQIGVKLDEDHLKILDELPNSAVEMQVKDKFLKKLNRQERVVEEVKLVLKPHYNKKRINKEEYKDILRRAVPKICHNKSGEINPKKIQNLIEAYVRKIRHSKKVTSSSSVNNPQKT